MNNTIDVQVCGNQGMFPYTYKTVVLKPNIINDKNILNQGMMNMPNTKYVIKYDFLLSDAIIEKTANVVSTNISHCDNPAYAIALANYNAAHEAWIEADNAYTNNPNDATLAAKNAAYAALEAAQLTLNGIPQYYYFAGSAINIKKGQHISIPEGCVLLNDTRNGIVSFDVAPNDMTVYIGSAITGEYNYKIQGGIELSPNCLIEFDGGSISDGVLIGNETILIFDQEEEVILKNVELLGDFEYSAGGSGGVNKKDNVNGMATITLKKNKSFASQLTTIDTIYRIMYDFDLGGETVTIPEGCVLEFDGGSIKNGIIVGNNTAIDAVPVKIFSTDISLEGTWNIKECYPEWWGAKGNDATDDTAAFTALAAFVTAIDGSRVFISKKTYLITAAIYFKGNIEFCGVGADSVLHLGNSNTGIHFGEKNDYTLLDSYLTDGDGTITGKTINDDEVTCKSTVKGDRIIKVSNASAFVVNELYVIQDTCDFSFNNSRAYYRQGEIIKIKSIDTTNNTITLYNGLCGIYGNDDNFEGYVARENVRLFEQRFITCLSGITHRTIFYKYNFKQVNLHNFKIRSEGNNTSYGSGYYALSVYNVIHSKIDSIEITSEEGSHVSFRLDGAYKSSILNSKFHTNFTAGNDLYGASLGDIQDVLVSNCTFGGIGHSLATGSKPDAGAIVNRNFIYERLSFDPIRDPEDSITLDVHAGSEYYTYKNIFFPSGACDLGGYNITVENCVFRFIQSSFFQSGLTIRKTECLGIGALLAFLSPWRDYSNDEIIIEDCKIKGGHNFGSIKGSEYSINFTSQLPDRAYPINNLIIRNSIIEDGIFIRYKLANTIIIENNIVSLKDNRSGISIYQRKNDNNNNYIIIRNNKIIQNFDDFCISIGDNTNTSTNVEEIAGNLIIEDNYIQSNVYTEGNIRIDDIYNGVIKGNQIIAKRRIIEIVDSNCGVYNNIMVSNDESLIYYIEATTMQNHYNIDFDDSNITKRKGVALRNYQTNKYRVHYGYSDVRNHVNLFAQDDGYGFFDLNLNKTVKVHFTNKSIIKDDFFPTGDADGVFVPNDLVDGAIYNLGLRRKSDFYLAKTNINPKEGDLKPICSSWSNGWDYQFFKNEGEYPYLYFVNTRYEVGDRAQYRIYELDIWKEEDGASAGVKRSGATTDRPTGYYIYVGFKYMDTTLGKPIYAIAISDDTVTWVDATGTTV